MIIQFVIVVLTDDTRNTSADWHLLAHAIEVRLDLICSDRKLVFRISKSSNNIT